MAEAIGGKGSLVWNYFTKVSDSKAKCNVCGKELASTSGSTISLARHLESKHRDKFAEYTDAKKTRDAEREGIRKRKQMDDGPPKKQAKLSFHTPANDQALQEQFKTALLEHIAKTQSPFSQIGTPSFIKLIGIANKRIKVQHLTTLSEITWIYVLWVSASWGQLEDFKSGMERKWRTLEVDLADDAEPVQLDLELSPTSKLLQRSKIARYAGRGLSKMKQEMVTYESFSFASRNADVLAWWKTHETHLPILSKIAKKILAIPASSAKSERVFSTGGLVITAKRGRLSPSKVEDLILLKQNLSRVREFLDSTDYNMETGGHNAFKNIVVHIAEREAPVEDEVDDDIYDLDDIDDDNDEIVML